MSDQLRIITNHVPREILNGWDLSPAERADFDYVNWSAVETGSDSVSFARYKGELIDLGDLDGSTMGVQFPLQGWHAYRSDSFFSGLVFRFSDDGETVVIGRYSV